MKDWSETDRVDRTQRSILLSALCLIILMLILPPWLFFDGNTSNHASAGYHLLFNPPSVGTYEHMFGIPGDEVLTTNFARVYVNKIRLTAQILIVVFLAAGLTLSRMRQRIAASACFIALGLCATGFLVLLISIKY